MINTEVFKYKNININTCFKEVLKMVNSLIKEEGICKSDIVEYKTKIWSEDKDGICFWHYKVIISWWK